MATRYKIAGAHNWNDTAGWDDASSGGAGGDSYPVAGDTAILDAGSGNCTLTANAACLNLNKTGYTGTLALGASSLTIGDNGTVTLGGSVTGSPGSGIIVTGGNITIVSNSVSIPRLRLAASSNVVLTGNLNVTGLIQTASSSPIFSGSDIYCADFLHYSTAGSVVRLAAGQTLNISNSFFTRNLTTGTYLVIQCTTDSSAAYITYTGTSGNCNVTGTSFTDITFTNPVYQWNGGTLLRTSGITNVTAANLALAADASKILSGQTVGGVAGSAPISRMFKGGTL